MLAWNLEAPFAVVVAVLVLASVIALLKDGGPDA